MLVYVFLYIFFLVNNLYAMQVGGTLVPLLKFYFHEEVRKIVLSGTKNYCCFASFFGR